MLVQVALPHFSMEASLPALATDVDPMFIWVSPPVTLTV